MKLIFTALFAFLLTLFVLSAFGPRDDTDPPGWSRSGMGLHTDERTGCQYLSRPFGGITPRLDGAGRHIGCKS